MLGSNQRPLPCEGSVIDCWRFLEIAKCLQMDVFSLRGFSQHFRIFTRVAAHWRPYASSKVWKLISGAGKKTMYVLQYKDRAGNVSATASDAITYRP